MFFPGGPRLEHMKGDVLVAMNGPAQAIYVYLYCFILLYYIILHILHMLHAHNSNKHNSITCYRVARRKEVAKGSSINKPIAPANPEIAACVQDMT